ncbi:hypothetical protein ElyMa_000362000 [Elysia marginata]|uniref:CCHC-type domain-containing protein n=1 Tax=Elysia marginata TaxID=1093978 RepID=A0AAV4FHI1_9GAST|nr:hypothetical protein ElyMa_000362000 [Elysia marginata]
MKNAPKILKCSKCLEEGHLARQCHKDIVCWAYQETGHKESECPYDKSKDIGSDEDNETSASDDSETEAELETKKKSGDKNTAKSSKITKHSTKNEGDTKKEETKYKSHERGRTETRPKQTIPEMLARERAGSSKRNAPSPISPSHERRRQRARVDS